MSPANSHYALLIWLIALFSLVDPSFLPLRVPSNYSGEAQKLADPEYGPIPGQSDLYSSYWGTERPFPSNIRDPIFPTEDGPPGEDDFVWQNLLAAEWIIFDFYQQGIERFTDEDFKKIGMPDNTRHRLLEIRNNEAGHLRIFQNQISPTSIKPGPCEYMFPLTDPLSYLTFMTVIEISSMAFLTGLVQMAENEWNQGLIAGISQTEARHEAWVLIDIWKMNPFAGPADTVFPYANQILYSTHGLVVPGSCPPENPEYPYPLQRLPALFATPDTKSLAPGATITLAFTEADNQPVFDPDTQYYAVFTHCVNNISVPIDTKGFPERPITVTIPAAFETKGVIVALIADQPGAPVMESVVAGPAVILEQPVELGPALVRGAGGTAN
ncbi:ferritin-like domain-containing protein [Chaetomium tenue]|uniref:Ferritin-like domain-containing protein n=1 Tax=Chaetomium tenue TaxID=1854479 RepID=A0ACB7P7C4_9PEZI|nr:ferritin-like domain-containing protein [Chaetomium globosum]